MSEPAQLKRKAIGVWVLMFLAVFLVLSYMLKKQIWKDVS
jgi:ubiquinol-cytochrome c reductase cytochrome c1 subunit